MLLSKYTLMITCGNPVKPTVYHSRAKDSEWNEIIQENIMKICQLVKSQNNARTTQFEMVY